MSNNIISLSKDHNPNYVCSIVRISKLREHPNAEKLMLATVQGQTIIVGKDVKEGDIGIYFPLECQINPKFLSYCNLYRDKELNADKEHNPGFFTDKGRVRAVRLRGILSEGFWIEGEKFWKYLFESGVREFTTYNEGTEFDIVNDEWFVKKYIVQQRSQGIATPKQPKGAKISLIVENQFRFHGDTEQLARNMFALDVNDLISITYKIHGSSFIAANILTKNVKLPIYQRIGKALGFKVQDTTYSNIYASRRVIKNGWLLPPNSQHYYKEDIWGAAALTVQDHLEKGLTAYGEVCGYLSEGSMIQKGYDYGNNPGEFSTYIYRITYTNPEGKVFEFSMRQVQEYCKEHGINAVPEIYYGYVKDLFPIDYSDRDWRDKYLELLKSTYVENRMCHMCKNKVPAEGIVLRIDTGLTPRAYKLKNPEFLIHESKELDSGTLNIEDNG